jgi:hypothetical protein
MFEDSRPLTEEEWKIIYCRNGKNEPYPKENEKFWNSLESEKKKINKPSDEELNELKKMVEEAKDNTKHDPYSYAPKNIDQKLTKEKNDKIIESQPSGLEKSTRIIHTQRGSFSIQEIDELQNKYEELQNKYEVLKKWFKNTLTDEERQKLKNQIE